MKHTKLLSAVMAAIVTVSAMTVCLPSVSAYENYQDPTGHCTETDTPTEEPFDPTGHCEDWSNYQLSMDSDYCKERNTYSGSMYGTHKLTFTAPEDLEIVSFKFTLYHEDPCVSLKSYTPFTAMDCEEPDYPDHELYMLTGSFASTKAVTVKKGQPLLTADVKVSVADAYFFNDSGFRTTVYFEVEELQVVTAEGYKVIIGDEDTTAPAGDPYGPTDHCTTDPVPTSVPGESFDPLIATTTPAVPPVSVVIGDVDHNGSVNIDDATTLQRHIAAFKNADGTPIVDETDPAQMAVADVNRDGVISVKDVTMIQRYLAGMIETLG